MRVVVLMAVVLGFSWVGALRAEEPDDKSPVASLIDRDVIPPAYIRADRVNFERNEIRERVQVNKPVYETMERVQVVNGVERRFQVREVRYEKEVHERVIAYKSLRAVTPSGKEVSPEVLKKAVAARQLLVMSTEPSGNISQDVVKLFKDDVILLLAEREPPQPGDAIAEPPAKESVRGDEPVVKEPVRGDDSDKESSPGASIIDGAAGHPEYVKPHSVDLERREIAQRHIVQKPVQEVQTRRVVVEGAEREEQFTVTRYITEQAVRAEKFESLRAVFPNGKEVPPDTLKKAIEAEQWLVMSTDPDGNISRDVARLFKDDVILLLAERERSQPGDSLTPRGNSPHLRFEPPPPNFNRRQRSIKE